MKILFPALRVGRLDTSLAFYDALGLEVVGRVDPADDVRMAMLALPGEAEVSLELVDNGGPVHPGGLDHLAVQVDDLGTARARLLARGVPVGPVETPGGPDGPRTTTVADPDGHHIELVQWPPGHPVEMKRADFDPGDPEEPAR